MTLHAQVETNASRSPEKPRLLRELIRTEGLAECFDVKSDFPPFDQDDFLVAHTEYYADSFLQGRKPFCVSNDLAWSETFRDSVCHTNSSLYHPIRHAITNPYDVAFSPTSGFHHARPEYGSAYCTFSGQVIASIKVFREFGLSGAYLDLDGHYAEMACLGQF